MPCYNGGNCTEVGDSFVCKCACGYKGKQCEMKGIRITSASYPGANNVLKIATLQCFYIDIKHCSVAIFSTLFAPGYEVGITSCLKLFKELLF